MKNQPIKILITGGTIDGTPGRPDYPSGTHIPEMLKQGRCKVEISCEVLMLKSSAEMNESDREKILEKCLSCDEDQIILTHGTTTMAETGHYLSKALKNKTIVLVGSMVQYLAEESDALFNLGTAIASVQLLPPGVYISMHGKIFDPNHVEKDFEKLEFREK